MSNHHGNIVQERDKMQKMIEDKVDQFVEQSRLLRQKRQEQFGHIDQYRIVRDQACILDSMGPNGKTLLLSAALDRLAQLPNFDPASDLEALFSLDPEQDQS